MKKSRTPYPYLLLIPIILIFIMYYLILAIDPNFRDYIYNDEKEASQTEESTKELQARLSSLFSELPHRLPQDSQDAILASPYSFLQDIRLVYKNTEDETLLLVDKTHSLPEDFVPSDLASLDDHSDTIQVNKKDLYLHKKLLADLQSMILAAGTIALDISSAYRSYEYQKNLYNYYVTELGEEEASRQSAYPGTSQHQLGTAIDFGSISPEFEFTEAGQWLLQNACTYGFSLSYPEGQEALTGYIFESWHYRYIGIPACSFDQKYFSGRGQQHSLEILSMKDSLDTLIKEYL